MGSQVCCQADIAHSIISDNLQKAEDYQDSQWPENDQIIQQWLKNNENEQMKQKKLKKHTRKNQYFLINWQNDQPTGKGLLYQVGRFLYEGDFENGRGNGRAYIKFLKDNKTERIYDGEIENGKAEGEGSYDNLNQKYRFQGKWKDSKPEVGTLSLSADQNVSKIYFSNFEERKATVFYKDERIYEGQLNISKLVPDGVGKVTFSNNKKESYEGQWQRGRMHGNGTFTWKDQSQYEGRYIENKKEGFGEFIYTSGKRYKGYWRDGKQDGTGILHNKLGIPTKKGIWKNGVFQKILPDEEWQQVNEKYQKQFRDIIQEKKEDEEKKENINETKRQEIRRQIEEEVLNINESQKRQLIKKEQENGKELQDNANKMENVIKNEQVQLKQVKSEYQSDHNSQKNNIVRPISHLRSEVNRNQNQHIGVSYKSIQPSHQYKVNGKEHEAQEKRQNVQQNDKESNKKDNEY